MAIPADLLVHVATVTPYDPDAGDFGDEFELPCYFEQQVTTTQRDSEGSAAADAMLYADPATDATTVLAGSRLTVNGKSATVLTVEDFDDGGITGLAHRELSLRVWTPASCERGEAMTFMSIELDTSQVLAYAGKLEAAAGAAPVRGRAALTRTAKATEASMKSNAPVLTGTLRDSVTSEISGDTAEIGPTVRYAGYVENGTSVMAPEPYAGPAFDQHAPELETLLGAAGAGLL